MSYLPLSSFNPAVTSPPAGNLVPVPARQANIIKEPQLQIKSSELLPGLCNSCLMR